MNRSTTMGTAILRGVYLALGSGLLSFLLVWATTDELKAPIVAGGVAALTALGFRAGVEGLADASRNRQGRVLPGDVGGRNR